MSKKPKDEKMPIPAWLVSFGDMMTLILTFFILLVSMAQERQYGMMADGLGSFVSALKSHGLPGMLSDSERKEVLDNYRRRFNLPVEEDPDRRESHRDASDVEQLRSEVAQALAPHDELFQPEVASFEPDSSTLGSDSRAYLDRLAPTLRPGRGQLLLLEGHATDAAERFAASDLWLAGERARVVRDYLIEEHGFSPNRVEARAWLAEVEISGPGTRRVDMRLVTPKHDPKASQER